MGGEGAEFDGTSPRRKRKHQGPAPGVVIITGQGKHSSTPYSPVVRPEVQRMLLDEFYPPLWSTTTVGNTGRLVVDSDAIQAYYDGQKARLKR